jgi:hypothetical protein
MINAELTCRYSIHLPSLRTAGPPSGRTALSTGSGIDINQGDSGISLEIPLLEAVVGDLSIQGTIIRFVRRCISLPRSIITQPYFWWEYDKVDFKSFIFI